MAALGPLVVPKSLFDPKNEPTVPPKYLQGSKIASKMTPKVPKMTPTVQQMIPKVLLKINSVGTLKLILTMARRTARSVLNKKVRVGQFDQFDP